MMTTIVPLSRPTFAEIAHALAKAGCTECFDESGDIVVDRFTLRTDDSVRQSVRLAAAIEAAALPPQPCVASYADDQVELHTRIRPDGVHIVEVRPGLEPRVVTMPREAIMPVAGDLVAALGIE